MRTLRAAGILALFFGGLVYLVSLDFGSAVRIGGIAGGLALIGFGVAELYERNTGPSRRR
ncbi:MAG: hypothetical protein CVU47_04230 [Chloroflexi bacterium HGW-Chloroflexi-9]|nr:MAG: hypothetical protein CVU47_04230 [Chloroflexi bacterium HGW-Chloroflexi-9]